MCVYPFASVASHIGRTLVKFFVRTCIFMSKCTYVHVCVCMYVDTDIDVDVGVDMDIDVDGHRIMTCAESRFVETSLDTVRIQLCFHIDRMKGSLDGLLGSFRRM